MNVLKLFSIYSTPFIIVVILVFGIHKKVNVYDAFLEGAKEGMEIIFKITPSLVGLLFGIGIFRASGALDWLVYLAAPVAKLLHIPPEVLPLAFLRPISGSASLALVSDIVGRYHPDSLIGRVASTMMGSTETIFYTLTVYYGAIGIKNIRHTLYAALIADAVSVIASSWVCRAIF